MSATATTILRCPGALGAARRAAGFTVIECLVALAILGLALTALMPTFVDFLDANTTSESRSDSVAAAQQIMEGLRRKDPSVWPTSGKSSPEVVAINDREFEVVKTFCKVPKYCGAASRHVVVEVSYGGRVIYSVESVYTNLQ